MDTPTMSNSQGTCVGSIDFLHSVNQHHAPLAALDFNLECPMLNERYLIQNSCPTNLDDFLDCQSPSQTLASALPASNFNLPQAATPFTSIGSPSSHTTPSTPPDLPTTDTSMPCPSRSCSRKFLKWNEFTRHQRSHVRPEKCPHCGRGFETKKDVRRRVNDRHETATRYFCDVENCQYAKEGRKGGIPREENLRRHVRGKHQDI